MTAKAHRRHDQTEIGAVAAHHRDIRLAGKNLRDLTDASGRFLVHHIIRMFEDAQQIVPMQVALHPRRIVVDAKRQIGRVGDVEEEALDVGFRCADISGRGKNRAVGAVVLGESDTSAMVESVLLPVQPKKIGIFAVFILAVSTMICFFSSGDKHRRFPGRPHDQNGRGAVIFMKLEQRSKRRRNRRIHLY